MLYGEAAIGVNLDRGLAVADPVLLGRDQRGLGWYAAIKQEFTRYVEAGVRFDNYHPSLDRTEFYDGVSVITRHHYRTVTPGVALRLPLSQWAQARLLAEYAFQQNTLGRDADGRPAHLDNDTFRLRAEVRF